MIRLRLIFSAFLFVVALFSAHVSAAGVDKVSFEQSLINSELTISQLSHPQLDESVGDYGTSKQVDEQPSDPGFEPVQFRVVISNSSVFLHQLQVEPNYTEIFEFSPPSLARELFLQPLEPAVSPPWYTAYEGTKSRLSGWKDANLLYRAVNTYHS